MSDDQKIQIISAQVRKFQTLGNTMLISAGNDGNGAVINRQRAENQPYFSDDKPMIYAPNANFQFTIVTGKGLLSSNQSYITYTIKYALKAHVAITKDASNITNVNSGMGKYYVQNKGYGPWWYFDEYKFSNGSWKPDTSISPIALCAAPMNSCALFNKSQFIYRNINNQDDNLFRQSVRAQQQISNDCQNSQNQTWFNGDLPSLEFFALPYKYVSGVKTYVNLDPSDITFLDGTGIEGEFKIKKEAPQASKTVNSIVTYYFNKTYTIPLNVINQVLDSTNAFPLCVLGYEQVRLNLFMQSYHVSRIFGTNDLLEEQETGLIDLELIQVTKDSDKVRGELNSKDGFSYHYMKFDYELLPSLNIKLSCHRLLNRGHDSTADVILGLQLSDENFEYTNGYGVLVKDSMYLKQRFTLFNGEQQYKIINNVYDQNEEFNWFTGFNLWKGNRSNALFSQDIENLTQFKCEMLRGLNLYNQYEKGMISYDSMMKLMCNYALITLNLQAFSIDTNEDVIGDGIDSISQKLYIDTKMGFFKNGKKSVLYDDSQQAKTKIDETKTPINIEVMQVFDCALKFNVSKQSMTIDENFIQNGNFIQKD
ncbi:Conserved_hypothetical protein [Hexamita inflata]|uniref:Uncharacterized protein n=1 Tax=Hexamita inflata TaxID=28002 RepID=A0AA86QGR0_9EUKA|nr:Conserved hypothetical protein [Hexamita inflata]